MATWSLMMASQENRRTEMHGTGKYWNRIYKADLEKDEFAVIVFRLFEYEYEQMSDSVEPTSMACDKYKIEVLEWRRDRYNHKVADELSNTITTGSIDREMAREIDRKSTRLNSRSRI